MRLLLALDSRPANLAGVGVLDMGRARWEHFEVVGVDGPAARPPRRRGFRGAHLAGDALYAVNSAAVYRLRVRLEPPYGVRVDAAFHRPEWALGERAAADLHDVHLSAARERLFVANSFMDAVDELSLDGRLVRRHYLWDISPDVAALARDRDPGAADLVHVNHIEERDGELLLTLGNCNGTRAGRVISFDTGRTLLSDLPFPHDGVFARGRYYLSLSGAAELAVYDARTPGELARAPAPARVPIRVRQDAWAGSFQWVRGIAVTERYVVCGVTQWRDGAAGRPQIPPRLVVLRRDDHALVGELFLPEIDGFPTPSIFTVYALDDGAAVDGAAWPVPGPRRAAGGRRDNTPARREISEISIPVAGWTAPAGRAAVGREDGGLAVTACGGSFYVSSSPGSFAAPPAASALAEALDLAAGGPRPAVTVAQRLAVTGAVTAQLWVVYYDGDRRIGDDRRRLRDGDNALRLEVPDAATTCRLAVRIDGEGRCELSPVRVSLAPPP